jgi:hypothetical protein
MKVLLLVGIFFVCWISVGFVDDVSGYHAAPDIPGWVSGVHDTAMLLWGGLIAGGGVAVAAIARKRP